MQMPEPVAADASAIAAHLDWLTRRWSELNEPCEIELRALGEDLSPQSARFPMHRLHEAVEWAAGMNRLRGRNIYAVVNPLRPWAGRDGTDADVIASFVHWADADAETAITNLRSWAGPKWRALVRTGTVPHDRVHVYWELADPIRDMAAWRETQSAIAARLASDPAVINPSRIMRLGGTISWPNGKKQSRGYVSEMATFRLWPERELLDGASFARVFAGAAAPQQAASGGFEFEAGVRPSLDREAAAQAALAGQDWHAHVIRLVGSYVAKGLSDDEIHALTVGLTLPGYTVDQTRREVQIAINGARRKGWAPEPQQQPAAPEPINPDTVEPTPFRPWVEMDLSRIPRVEFLYGDFYARGYTSVTLAEPKRGKSMLALAEAIDMATGRGFLTGVERAPQVVVYFNAEDDQNVVNNRVAALLSHYGIPQSEIVGRLYATSGVDWDNFYLMGGDPGDVREETFIALEKFIHASGADVLIFDPLQDLSDSPETNEVFRKLGRRIRKMASGMGVAVGLVHHTRKVAPGLAPTIDDGRGGSALRGTARFNRILAGMTEDEAVKAGVENHRWFLRIGDAESNLAPPSSEVNRWFRKVSVETPSGEHVGAVERWEWPDAFDGVSASDAARVRSAFASSTGVHKESPQAKDWGGLLVCDVLSLDPARPADRAKVKRMIETWVKSGVLAVENQRCPVKREMKPCLVAGPVRPGDE